jgi:hypothetical protein
MKVHWAEAARADLDEILVYTAAFPVLSGPARNPNSRGD